MKYIFLNKHLYIHKQKVRMMNLICVHSIPELCFEDIGKGLIIGLSNCWSGFARVLFVGLKFLVSGTLSTK